MQDDSPRFAVPKTKQVVSFKFDWYKTYQPILTETSSVESFRNFVQSFLGDRQLWLPWSFPVAKREPAQAGSCPYLAHP